MAGEQRIQLVNAIAVARGSQEPSNLDIFWVDENITGAWYEKLKAFNSNNNSWELVNRSPEEILDAIKTVDGAGSGLDADTLQGYTPAQFSVPALSTGQVLVGQADTIGTAQSVGGIATIQADGTLVYVNGSISHTGLSNIGTNTHAEIDAHISDNSNPHSVTASQVGNTVAQWNANQLQGSTLNIGTPGVGEDAFAVTWDNTAGEFVLAEGGSNISNANLSWSGGNTSQNLSGNELAFTGGLNKFEKVELTATDRGLLINRVTTAQMNLISSPTTNEIVYNTDLNGLYRYDGANWVGLSAGYGLVSVTDSSGTPTFYATIQSAITNSSSGETVTLHTDITETSTTTINLKDGVNINLNGYTYTLNQASTNNCFSDNNIALECHIMNGVVKRTGGTFSSSNSFCLEVDGNSLIKCHTTVFESDFGTAARVDGTVEGGVFKGIQGAYINSGKLKNAICYGTTSNGITAINVGSIYNCKGYSDSGDGIIGAGYIFNCYGESYSGNGVDCNASSFSFNVTGVSNSGIGVTIDSDGMNINGKSNSNYGVRLESGFNSVTDVKGYSNSNYGVSFSSGSGNGVFTNIVAHSKSNIAMSMLINAGSVYFTNITAITEWNNTGGHGIVVAGSDTDHYIIGAKIKVASSSAYGISGSKSIHYSNVNVVGATTGIDPSITNLTTNIIDSQGNITTN